MKNFQNSDKIDNFQVLGAVSGKFIKTKATGFGGF